MRQRTRSMVSNAALLLLLPALVLAGRAQVNSESAVGFSSRQDRLILASAHYVAQWSAADGSWLSLTPTDASAGAILTGGAPLWRVCFADAGEMDAARFLQPPVKGSFTHGWDEESCVLTLAYESRALAVAVRLHPTAEWLDVQGTVRRTARPILRLDLPARIDFPAEKVQRVVFPQQAGKSVGIAFTRAFFSAHAGADAPSYRQTRIGGEPYASLFGGPLRQLGDDEPPVALRITDAGRRWLSAQQVRAIERHEMIINRPPAPGQMPLVLVDSPCGAALCGADLGGKGLLMRFCGRGGHGTETRDSEVQALMVLGACQALAEQRPTWFGGRSVGLIALQGAPDYGGWTPTTVSAWQQRLANAPFVRQAKAELELIETPAQLRRALTSSRFALILNPYGEWLPTGTPETWRQDLAVIRDFVRGGGIWWEVGGYPFYYAMELQPYLNYTEQYPAANADFVHVGLETGALAIFGVQPVMTTPWPGSQNPDLLTVPAELQVGADAQGGYYRHGWHHAVEAGSTWTSPWLRLRCGPDAKQAVAEYAHTLGIDRKLDAKARPEVTEKLRNSVLIRLGGSSAAEQIRALDWLPSDNIVHFTEYLHGGFDKQYPDHLPPRSSWGTVEDLQRFYREGKARGHLMMPYTNTSWWCIDPKGPTFEREGEAPLSRRRDGGLLKERYARNEGYRVCFWHPAVQKAHRRTRTQMTEQFPSDILLQDQVGARSWSWDYNPAAPTATAWIDGLHSLSMEDAAHVPLATEDGYDRVVNFEAMLCGMGWAIVPSGGRRERQRNCHQFAAQDWEIFPLMQYLAHDKAIFALHDLGHFITDLERQAYAVGLGYSMSYGCTAAELETEERLLWLHWLDAVQKAVCARYAGQPLIDFAYPLRQAGGTQGRTVVTARYPNMTIVANVSDEPLELSRIASVLTTGPRPPADAIVSGPGFYAITQTMEAGVVLGSTGPDVCPVGFVVMQHGTGTTATILAPENAWVGLPARLVPAECTTAQLQAFAGQGGPSWGTPRTRPLGEMKASFRGLQCVSDGAGRQYKTVGHSYASSPPADVAGTPRTIAVFDPGNDAPAHWVLTKPEDFADAVRASAKLAKLGFRVSVLGSVSELIAALQSRENSRPFAVINPGGECFPTETTDDWKHALDAVAEYIRTGGIWWETGGYSFYACAAPQREQGAHQRWAVRNVGPAGAARLGFSCAGYDVDEPPRRLTVTDTGRAWLGEERAALLSAAASGVQRPFSGLAEDVVLVRGGDDGFVAAIRCGGWGWLWRLGGFRPDPGVAREAVVGVLEYLAANPWPQPQRSTAQQLWRVRVRPQA